VNRRNPVDEEFEAPACPRCVSKNNDDIGETATGELLTSFVVGKLFRENPSLTEHSAHDYSIVARRWGNSEVSLCCHHLLLHMPIILLSTSGVLDIT